MIYTVPKDWKGQTCVILAGGPSLRKMDLLSVFVAKPKVRVITINDSWRLAPRADALFFTDAQWWHYQTAKNLRTVYGSQSFHELIYQGFWVSSARAFEDHPQVHYLHLTGQRGLETNPEGLRHGSNSGYAAINLAYLYGATKIILLGYDMKVSGMRTHWHDEPRPAGFGQVLEQTMLPNFDSLVSPLEEAGVEVINATPDSALTCWKYLPLEEALSIPVSQGV